MAHPAARLAQVRVIFHRIRPRPGAARTPDQLA
jgi:hypothetical protein